MGANKICGPNHVLIVNPKTASQSAPQLGIQTLDMRLIKPGGKLLGPELKELVDSSASFAIKPAMNGYKGAVRTLLPAPCSLLRACCLRLAPCFLLLAPCSLLLAPSS